MGSYLLNGFFLLCCILYGEGLYAEDVTNPGKKFLVVGTTSGYAPFVSLDNNGRYEGFDIDVAEQLAKKLNRDLSIQDCGSMPGLMLSLKQGKVDILIWAISITTDRMKNMDMVYYQGEKVTEIPFLFWKQIPEEIKSIEDLGKNPDNVICVEAGTSQEDILKKVPSLNLKYVDKITDAILEIRYEKSFTTTVDPSLLVRFMAQHPEIKVLYLPLPPQEHVFGCGICIDKKNPHLTQEIKKAIDELREEKVLMELEKKWKLIN